MSHACPIANPRDDFISNLNYCHRLSKLITLSNKKKAGPLFSSLPFFTSHTTFFLIKQTNSKKKNNNNNKYSVSTNKIESVSFAFSWKETKKNRFDVRFVPFFDFSFSNLYDPLPLKPPPLTPLYPPSFHRLTNFVYTVTSTVAKSRRNNGLEEKQIDK